MFQWCNCQCRLTIALHVEKKTTDVTPNEDLELIEYFNSNLINSFCCFNQFCFFIFVWISNPKRVNFFTRSNYHVAAIAWTRIGFLYSPNQQVESCQWYTASNFLWLNHGMDALMIRHRKRSLVCTVHPRERKRVSVGQLGIKRIKKRTLSLILEWKIDFQNKHC